MDDNNCENPKEIFSDFSDNDDAELSKKKVFRNFKRVISIDYKETKGFKDLVNEFETYKKSDDIHIKKFVNSIKEYH